MSHPLRAKPAAVAGGRACGGTVIPDWSVIESARAGYVLAAIAELLFPESRFADFDDRENRVRQAILRHYGAHGRAPSRRDLAGACALTDAALDRLLARLAARDLIVIEAAGGAITGAYPFTDRDTGHRVWLDGVSVNAMCAIDALGAGAMVGREAKIESACRHCGGPIVIQTARRGRALDLVTPPETVVWCGRGYDGCAATSLCLSLLFFCGEAHLNAWRTAHPGPGGSRLSPEEALQVGRALFANALSPAEATSER